MSSEYPWRRQVVAEVKQLRADYLRETTIRVGSEVRVIRGRKVSNGAVLKVHAVCQGRYGPYIRAYYAGQLTNINLNDVELVPDLIQLAARRKYEQAAFKLDEMLRSPE